MVGEAVVGEHRCSGVCELNVIRTKVELNINPEELNLGSHKKVWFVCKRCNQDVLKEFRKSHTKHACPKYIYEPNGQKLKWCPKCRKFLIISLFGNNSARFDGLYSICNICRFDKPPPGHMLRMRRGMAKRTSTVENWIKWTVSHKKAPSMKRACEFSVTTEYLIDLWYKQNGKCFYFGAIMQWGNNSLYSAHLDRMDPNFGYNKNNVAWCCKAMNFGKGRHTVKEFNEFLELLKKR